MTDTVTIPREEYEQLIERNQDLQDIIDTRQIMARIERGEEETVPSEFVDRMLEGESLIKLWREHRGLSIMELSRMSGRHRVNIGKFEAGDRGPSVDSLKKLADALGVAMDDLV